VEGVARYRESGRFRSWLFMIAHNGAITALAGRSHPATGDEVENVLDPA
jgi:DNA-directed RNA polymerase specialized sigma24 family protein